MTAAATRPRPGNLTAALVVFAALELLLNRLAGRLFLPQLPQLPPGAGKSSAFFVSSTGPLLFHLTGVLGLFVLLAALAGLLLRGELFPRAIRFTVLIVGLAFWVLVASAVAFGVVPASFFLHLEISFGSMALLVIVGALVGPMRRRVKLGVALFGLPGVLHAAALVGERRGWMSVAAAGTLAHVGELTLLLACLAAPVLLPPRPPQERRWRLALGVATALTAALIVAMATRFDLMQASFLYGLRLELPRLGSWLGLAYVTALFCWSYTAAQLLLDKGGMRLAGYGLLLLAIAGYQVTSPVEFVLALVGLLALSVGELRAVPYGDTSRPRVTSADWRAYVGRLATAAGDGTSPDDLPPEAVIVEEGELEVSRIRAHRRGLPVALRLLRRRGVLSELEVTVGEAGRSGPDASIERHRTWLARSPEQRVAKPRVKTGDASFDERLSVHGAAPLGDPGLRGRVLRAAGGGVLSLWSGAAARYHAIGLSVGEQADPPFSGSVDGEAPVGNVVAILDTLADLVEASAAA